MLYVACCRQGLNQVRFEPEQVVNIRATVPYSDVDPCIKLFCLFTFS
jgi:hypothetical protein